MKLYLISQSFDRGYDTFDSAVVVARNEEDARNMLPSEYAGAPRYSTWAAPEHVTVHYLGTAKAGSKAGDVVMASFNAG